MKIPVIYSDRDLLVVNKPAGILMHGIAHAKSGEDTLADWLLKNYPEVRAVGDDPINRPGIVHRLDKETSGVVLVARNQRTFDYLKSLFQNHLIQKTYLALVYGKLSDKQGVINKPIGIKSGSVKRSVLSSKMRKSAITEYRVKDYLTIDGKEYSLAEVTPKTGRTHQIRVHLASIGHPVMGDKLYGGKRGKLEGLNRQFLHAQSIEFTAPSGERLKFEAELPKELGIYLDLD
jgi:23S rRNA pseudouridine1911/1915/1917 synthase